MSRRPEEQLRDSRQHAAHHAVVKRDPHVRVGAVEITVTGNPGKTAPPDEPRMPPHARERHFEAAAAVGTGGTMEIVPLN